MVRLASSNTNSTSDGETAGPGGGPSGHEVEIKFRTDAAGLGRALASPILAAAIPSRLQNLRTIYFDTPLNDLRKNGLVLRIRKNGRSAPVLGVKSISPGSGELFLRTEIEVRSPDLQPNLSLLDANTASKLTYIVGNQPLEPKFETQIKRRHLAIDIGDSNVEVALDAGLIVVGDQRVPLTEVELELKSGNEPDLCELGLKLAEDLPLQLDFVSKGEKGFRLALREPPAPVRAGTIQFEPDATLDSAITAIISHTLSHFVANWAALRESSEPEAIHQLRVSLRRMRSGLSIAKRPFPIPNSMASATRPSGSHRSSARLAIAMSSGMRSRGHFRVPIARKTAKPC